MTYESLQDMPTYQRRFYLNLFLNDIDKQHEAREAAQQKHTSAGSGTRNTSITGEALKNHINTNQIPNQ